MNVSGCNSKMGAISPVDEMMSRMQAAGDQGALWRRHLDLSDALTDDGRIVAYAVSSKAGQIPSEFEACTPIGTDSLPVVGAGAYLANVR